MGIEEFKFIIKECVENELDKLSEQLKPKEFDELISISAMTKMFNISKVTLHKWKKQGVLPFYRLGGRRVYFKKNEVLGRLRQGGPKQKI